MSNDNNLVHLKKLHELQQIFLQISIPYSIIVAMIGIPGNVLTIIMLSKRSLTKNFNNCTLIALATTDLLFNLALVSRCISDSKFFSSIYFCQILAFVSHLAELLSACFTAHFTVQRFIAVRFPLSIFIEKNIHSLHYSIVTMFVLLGTVFCFALIKMNIYEHGCQESLDLKWFISDALSSFVIPFSLIAILNSLIIFHLRKTTRNKQQLSFAKRSRRQRSEANQPNRSSSSFDSISHSRIFEGSSGQATRNSIYQFPSTTETHDQFLTVGTVRPRTASIRSTTRHHAQSHRVTRMLILVSTCFLLLNAPSHICAIGFKLYSNRVNAILNSPSTATSVNQSNATLYDNSTSYEVSKFENYSKVNWRTYKIFSIFLIITLHVSYLSYSINFFLYSFCGMKFRSELMKFFSRCRKLTLASKRTSL